MRRTFVVVGLLGSLGWNHALANPSGPTGGDRHPLGHGTCGTPSAFSGGALRKAPHIGIPSKIIYLERCVGGCQFTGATTHNATLNQIAIQGTSPGAVYTFPEFTSASGMTGAAADDEWNQIVQCVRKVYSYYNTEVTDVKPTADSYHQALVAGIGDDLGMPDPSLLGISDVDCGGAIHNMTSFTFAGSHRPASSASYVKNVCWTITHEAGHSFGLEHEFEFFDGTSACNDPMSYDTGECDPPFRFFRNKPALCGGFELEGCFCSPQAQNSHTKLSAVFGTVNPPANAIAEITTPLPDTQVGPAIVVSVGHDRGVERVELLINNFKWAEQPGLAFQGGGQPNPGGMTFPIPETLPDSILDIKVRIYDDLGNMTESQTVTAVKGAACASESTCNEGQKCEAGRCFWDPPTGEIGDPCTYPEACVSGRCSDQTIVGEGICTSVCVVGVDNACPEGLECITVSGSTGICYFPSDDGGCCSTSRSTPWAPLALATLALGWLVLPRRRRR